MRLALAAALVVAVVAAAAWAGRPSSVSAADARIEGLRARLVERPSGRGSWSARWRLCWRPVAGARGYVVRISSSEGADPRPYRVSRPCWALTVATGVPRRRDVGRQTALIAPQLSVRVAALLPGGRTGPSSRDVAVGLPYS